MQVLRVKFSFPHQFETRYIIPTSNHPTQFPYVPYSHLLHISLDVLLRLGNLCLLLVNLFRDVVPIHANVVHLIDRLRDQTHGPQDRRDVRGTVGRQVQRVGTLGQTICHKADEEQIVHHVQQNEVGTMLFRLLSSSKSRLDHLRIEISWWLPFCLDGNYMPYMHLRKCKPELQHIPLGACGEGTHPSNCF